MVARYMVGTTTGRRAAAVVVEAEDALVAALKVKQENPAAAITYVRKHNERGDRRHPHRSVAGSGASEPRPSAGVESALQSAAKQ
jgi:hypothetical protein